jgi:hypothetical protein
LQPGPERHKPTTIPSVFHKTSGNHLWLCNVTPGAKGVTCDRLGAGFWGQAAPGNGYRDAAVHSPPQVEASARWRPRRAMCGSRSFTRPWGRCLDGRTAGKTSGMGARRDGRLWQCGVSGVGVARLFLRARAEGESPSMAFIPGPKAVGQCLACQGRGVAAWARATASYAPVRRRPGWVAGAATADAWHERNGEEGRRTRRPIPLRKPRGARGASAFVSGPRWGLRRRQRTTWRPASRCTLWSAGCPKYFQVALFDRRKLQKVEKKWSKQ